MIKQVKIKNFKSFEELTFMLDDVIVLAGPNNSGKTTLLQAISTWNLALRRWMEVKSRSSAKKYKGVQIVRKDFAAIPLREFNLLWKNRSAHYRKSEAGGKSGSPRLIEIELAGDYDSNGEIKEWSLPIAIRYDNPEMVYAYPELDDEESIRRAASFGIVHVPCFSGIGVEETRYDRGWQDKLTGEGKPGDILRNLLLEIHEQGEEQWNELVDIIKGLFNYTLLEPIYAPQLPTITCEYLPGVPSGKGKNGLTSLDIASGGSGFHQVLTLLSFFIARPSSLLLLDEPDAHLHVILQRDVFDVLKQMAREKKCQLIVATHSRVLIDSTSPSSIISFLRSPHRLVQETERDQVREALKRISSMELMLAEQAGMVLYLEDETDFKILREFSKLLDHPTREFFEKGFFHPNRGCDPKEAKTHLFALRAINPGITGYLILDRDYRDEQDHEYATSGMTITRWRRYEIENYLLVPEAIKRFCSNYGRSSGAQLDIFAQMCGRELDQYFSEQFPRAAIENPLEDSPFLLNTRASKDILPEIASRIHDHLGVHLGKKDYFQLVRYFSRKEVHPEIIEKLDRIWELYTGE